MIGTVHRCFGVKLKCNMVQVHISNSMNKFPCRGVIWCCKDSQLTIWDLVDQEGLALVDPVGGLALVDLVGVLGLLGLVVGVHLDLGAFLVDLLMVYAASYLHASHAYVVAGWYKIALVVHHHEAQAHSSTRISNKLTRIGKVELPLPINLHCSI